MENVLKLYIFTLSFLLICTDFFLHLEQFAFSEEIILFLANRKLLRKRKADKGLLGK